MATFIYNFPTSSVCHTVLWHRWVPHIAGLQDPARVVHMAQARSAVGGASAKFSESRLNGPAVFPKLV